MPSDKTFSPVTFLTVVHGTISFSQLRTGLDHLREQLKQQSRRRENLVRLHFGLFVQCADGLEWLKLYRKGGEGETPFTSISYVMLLLSVVHLHLYRKGGEGETPSLG